MLDSLIPLATSAPGFFGNGTVYQSKGRWRSGNFIRFHEGTMQPIGGWRQTNLTGAAIAGTPHAALCWQFEDGTPFLAFGTTQGLYVIDAANVVYDITPAPADIQEPEYDWQLSNFGAYLVATNSLRGDADISKVNVFIWTGDTGAAATPAWTDDVGPLGAYACFATAERQLVVLRGQDPSTHTPRTGVDSAYSERRSYFASTEELGGFVSTDTNTGGDFDLQTGGRLVTGAAGKQQSLIWTDVDLWTMTFIGGDFIYSYAKAGDDCGIVGKRAFIQIDKGVYWMGRGKFFVYDGFTRSIPCEVTDAVFRDFNQQRAHTVWGFSNARYNELTWFYPAAGSQWPDRYVTYNHVENHWVNGKLERTAGVPKRFNQDVIDETKPAFFNADGELFAHETGQERDGLAFAESGPLELGNGDRLMRLQNILDDTKASGDVQLRVYTAMAANALETLHGPYTLGPVTDLRLTARQVRFRIEEARVSSWRVGVPRVAARPVERRGSGPGAVDDVPASLEIIPSSVTLVDSQHYTFESIVRNAAGEVLDVLPDVWTSDNTAQVPVDENGTVTALATPAVALIQAFITDPALSSNIATVTVAGSVVPITIEIAPTAFDVVAGGSDEVLLTAVVKNAKGQVIVGQAIDLWETSDGAVATVTPVGVGLKLTANVAGVVAGNAAITARITTVYNVTSNPSVATVTDAYVTHQFNSADQFNVTTLGTGLVRVFAVGGGGGGGSVTGTGVGAGGGGAGETVDSETESVAVSMGDNPVNVGIGGDGGVSEWVSGLTVDDGNPGSQSNFAGVVAHGGGRGSATNNGGGLEDGGGPAGNGGGGRGDANGNATLGGAGLQHGGGNGGTGMGGGGGGAGGNGTVGGGGPGINNSILGIGQNFAAGGNGSSATTTSSASFVPGVAGSEGGNGSGNGGSAGKGGYGLLPGSGLFEDDAIGQVGVGGRGGNGVVIIRYKLSTGIVATGGIKVVHS